MDISPLAKAKATEVLAAKPGKVLRVGVQGAGCAGYQYVIELSESQDDDITLATGVVIDPMSATMLGTATLDYKDEVFEKRFFVDNPNAKTLCGCGHSFSM